MTQLSFRSVVAARDRLITYLNDGGVAYTSCHILVHDQGLTLVVVKPTSEIPLEFQGVPVKAVDSV